MNEALFYALLYLFEWGIAFFYMKKIFILKKNIPLFLAISLTGYALLYIIFCFGHSETLNIVSLTIVNFIIIYFAFESPLKGAVFHSMILSFLTFLTEFITVYGMSVITGKAANAYLNNPSILLIDIVMSKTLYMMFCGLAGMVAVHEKKSAGLNHYWTLAIMPVSSTIIIMVLREVTSLYRMPSALNTWCVLSALLLLGANVVVFFVYENSQKSREKLFALEMQRKEDELNRTYFEFLEQKSKASSILAHDIKNHLNTIGNIAASPEVDLYIAQICGDVEKYNIIGKSKNKMLDLVLSKYSTICRAKAISFTTNVLTENMAFMQDSDLTTLLNNMLDNAVEAAQKADSGIIKIEFCAKSNGFHMIKLTNSCVKKPVSHDSRLFTTKEDKGIHGIGTKSMEKIIEKYDGSFLWSYDEETKAFNQSIIFPAAIHDDAVKVHRQHAK